MTDENHAHTMPLAEPLTAREQEVLSLVGQGRTNRQIAEELVLAHGTVRWYLRQIYAKLGVEGRDEGVARARALGLIAAPAAGPAANNNLPAAATPLVGRQAELQELDEWLLDPHARLLTIAGPGGMGKTRLALALAARQTERRAPGSDRVLFPDGVWLVSLAPVESKAQLVPAIAEALDLELRPPGERQRSPEQQLSDFLRRKRLLLVLDNFEHLLDAAPLLARLLAGAPELRALVTSRQRLQLQGERVFWIEGLEVPAEDAGSAAVRNAAVRLFANTARRVEPAFALEDGEVAAVARICRLLEGMPLAIVLAAGWLEVLSPEEIAEEITQNLDFLESQLQDLPPRQRSVRATFEYSWKRLTAAEQEIFMKLSAFRGGFTREAAREVAGATAQTLRKLADKSFITMSHDGRYQMHALLHQYGRDRLQASEMASMATNAHRDYFLAALGDWEADLKGRRQLAALDEIEAELANVRAAWNTAVVRQDVAGIGRAVEALHLFFEMRGRFQEGVELLALAQRALAPAREEDPHPVWGRVCVRLAVLQTRIQTPVEEVRRNVERGMALARARDDAAEVAFCLLADAYYANLVKDLDRGLRLCRESYQRFRELGDRFYMARSLNYLSYFGYFQGLDILSLREESLELARQAGSRIDEGNVLNLLGFGYLHKGDYAAAEQCWLEAVSISREVGAADQMATVKFGLGLVNFLTGNLRHARQFARESLSIRKDINIDPAPPFAVLSLVAGISGDYELSRELGEQSRAGRLTPPKTVFSGWALAVAHCGLGQHAAAWNFLRSAAEPITTPGTWTWLLTVAAPLLDARGHKERAVKILGLVDDHPLSARGWMEKWGLLAELRASLLRELGRERYRSLWEEGKTDNLEEVATEVLLE